MYYYLNVSTDPNIVGNIRNEQAMSNTPIVLQESLSPWYPITTKLNPSFELERRAKLTDVLSCLSIGIGNLLVSEKAKSIFDKHRLMQHQYVPVGVTDQKGHTHTYYLLHLYDPNLSKLIDYKKTIFQKSQFGWPPFEEIVVDNWSEYERIKQSSTLYNPIMVSCREIYLSDVFDKNLDLFNLIIFDMNISISEKLKNALMEEEITGINIVDNMKILE